MTHETERVEHVRAQEEQIPYTSVYVTMSHPPGAIFQARLLDNQEGATSAITELYVSGKLSAGCSNADLCWHRHRHYSSCGDIEHVKSAQGGDAHRPIRYERRVQ